MRLLCKKFLLLLFPLVLIFAAMGFAACNGGGETPDDTVDSKSPLTAPQIELTENVISWTAVENAGKYEVYENNSRINVQTETSFTISQTAVGTYKYRIRALSADKNHSSSKLSNEVVYTVKGKIQLAAPQVSIDEAAKTVSWTAVEKADGYKVLENGEIVSSQAETSYTITHTETGKYKYTVIATSASEDYSESRSSNEVTYIISEQLATPHIELDEATKTISWTAVEHANTYFIYEDGYVIEASWDSTSYVIEQTIVGEHTYCITALGDDSSVYKMSEKSNTVTYVIEPTVLETPDGLKEERDLQGHVTLVWNEVEGAGGYNIYMNGLLVEKRWNINSYSINVVESGTYEYKVKAVPALGDKQYLESDKSEPIQITIEDNRTPLPAPLNLREEPRDYYYKDFNGNNIGKPVELNYLVWDAVENAEYYIVYESGERVFNTTGTDFEIQALYKAPKNYKFQVQAISHGMLYKSSELSAVYEGYKINTANITYTVNLNVDAVEDFSQSLQVGLFPQDNNGLPAQQMSGPITGTVKSLSADEPAEISYSNGGKFVAKIVSGLGAEYCATEVKLSATTTEGTILIYKKSAMTSFSVSKNNSVSVKEANEPISGLFIPQQAGQYTISTAETKEITISVSARPVIEVKAGITMFTFSADANEAVLISFNCTERGQYAFAIDKGAASKNQELKIGKDYGDNANAISGETKSVEYTLNLSEDTTFVFFFPVMHLGTKRFAKITVDPGGENEAVYEFDGQHIAEYKKNIFIRAGQNIKIRVDITGSTSDETLPNIYFFVYPLAED